MPKGLKETSSQIVISFTTTETAPNTFTAERIDLQLNALDNEVFVVTGVKMDLGIPEFTDGVGSGRHATFATLSKQDITNSDNRTLGNPSVFASDDVQISTEVPVGQDFGLVVLYQNEDSDAPYNVEYLDIIATPDFYVNINSVNQTTARSVVGKLYGYRARADSSTYAALVQSELLSNN